ncbi:hypothetical protein NWO25_02940 [Enterococcus lactis]|nr:hypothetical protein [Enterococcus lactis]
MSIDAEKWASSLKIAVIGNKQIKGFVKGLQKYVKLSKESMHMSMGRKHYLKESVLLTTSMFASIASRIM